MLYNLEPDRSVTGGAWYSDQDFESEFVEVLNQQCFKYLEQRVSPVKTDTVLNISSVKRNEQFLMRKCCHALLCIALAKDTRNTNIL